MPNGMEAGYGKYTHQELVDLHDDYLEAMDRVWPLDKSPDKNLRFPDAEYWDMMDSDYHHIYITEHDLSLLSDDHVSPETSFSWYMDCAESIVEDAKLVIRILNNNTIKYSHHYYYTKSRYDNAPDC